MAKTIKNLFGPAQLTNAAATKYTASANGPTEIRKIHLSNPSGAPVTVTISIGADAAGTRILDAYSMPATSVYDVWGPHVVPASGTVQAFASTTTTIVMTIDGYEYTAG